MKTQTIVAPTGKGARIFLENVMAATGWPAGAPYSVHYGPERITILRDDDAKRKLVASKGGVIDLQSKKVTQWANAAPRVNVAVSESRLAIHITRDYTA